MMLGIGTVGVSLGEERGEIGRVQRYDWKDVGSWRTY
jgi:hypothetical protein